MDPRTGTVLVALALGCGGVPATAPASVPVAQPPVEPWSDPPEYAIDHASAGAGETIFTRTGIGDPYATGIAYPVFLALLRAYPAELGGTPEAFAVRFGFLPRAADGPVDPPAASEGLPVGMHLTVDPASHVPFLVTNCALCHAERVRWPGGEHLVIGLGNRRVRVHAYDAVLHDLALRPDFTPATLGPLAAQAARERHLAWPPGWRDPMVRATLDALRVRARDRADFISRVRDGAPGRVATIESFAVAMERVVHHPVSTGATVGWARVPDVLGFAHRETLSWDGAGTGPIETLVVEADFAAGARARWFHQHPLQGASLAAYLRDLPRAPAFPGAIDRALAARGHALFDPSCAGCHGTYGPDGEAVDYTESVVPLRTLGVDPARAMALTDDFARAANEPVFQQGGLHTRRTGGYVPPVLTRVWSRAPYGHAAQWPSLAVLATAPDARPTRFVVDLDGPLDLDTVGLRVRPPGAPAGPGEYLQDATQPGLGVHGHPFLADLGASDARAVIEYLKTL